MSGLWVAFVWAIVKSVAVSLGVQVAPQNPCFISFEYIATGRIAGGQQSVVRFQHAHVIFCFHAYQW